MSVYVYVIATRKRKRQDSRSETEASTSSSTSKSLPLTNDIDMASSSSRKVPQCAENENDIGKWVGRSADMTRDKIMDMLKRCWTPPESYDFAGDATDSKRKFKHSWLKDYAPWLAYSKELKGALCLYCVLFPPPNSSVQGVLGSFIVKPFTRYKHLHESCRNHATNQWHQGATKSAKSFSIDIPVDVMMVTGHTKIMEENWKILSSIISSILFCGTHDLPLRGKYQNEGEFTKIK